MSKVDVRPTQKTQVDVYILSITAQVSIMQVDVPLTNRRLTLLRLPPIRVDVTTSLFVEVDVVHEKNRLFDAFAPPKDVKTCFSKYG